MRKFTFKDKVNMIPAYKNGVGIPRWIWWFRWMGFPGMGGWGIRGCGGYRLAGEEVGGIKITPS